MAIGKSRSSKRSSGTSYSSTVTTVVFIALGVLAVWMLTSNSLVSPMGGKTPSSTSKASVHSSYSSITDTDASSDSSGLSTTTTNNNNNNHQNPTFEDNPGLLPDDAIKPDEPNHLSLENPEEQSDHSKDSLDGDVDTMHKLEKENVAGANKEDKPDNEISVKENINVEENVKGEGSKVEENPLGLQGKESVEEKAKQKALEIQNSEESAVTQGQHANEISAEKQSMMSVKRVEPEERHGVDDHKDEKSKDQEDHQTDKQLDHEDEKSNVQEDHQTDKQVSELHHLSDEDQVQRIEEHQEQEVAQKKQDDQGSISHDQIQHDEEPLNVDSEVGNAQATETKKQDKQTKRRNKQHSKSESKDSSPGGESSGIPKESKESKKEWSTQADQSENQKERRQVVPDSQKKGIVWKLCNETAGTDFIPCLDNEKAISKLHSRHHYEHRERHCPEEPPTCLVPLPKGYKRPIEWPKSRDKIWYHNVPHTKLAEVKGHQNWVKVTGEFLTFPGGGTQFIHGALHYIDFIQESVPEIAWGKRTRVVLDVGCGVASFGGILFERDVIAMSFAPKDEHEAQVQFALERGIPAISAVMGTQRLPFPSRVFDLVHCARCRVPWHVEGGALLLELNRVLRPGGYFVWSATPVYQKLEEDVQIWKEMSSLTVSMCWELVTIKKDKLNSVGAAIYHKPDTNECYDQRKTNKPPMCKSDDDPNAAWYVPLQSCMHRLPVEENERGSQWPEKWPRRLQTPPYWLNRSQPGIYGKPAPDDFAADHEHWKKVVSKSYLSELGISWSNVRNIMDMRAVYGGFAAAMKDLKVWVLNVVNVDSPDTLPIIYERGLFGIYHDWCESFSTYPRTYDLLHADHLFSRLQKRCKIEQVIAEVDRIVRPEGKLIVRDESSTIEEVKNLLKSLHWEIVSQSKDGILGAQKSDWRPEF